MPSESTSKRKLAAVLFADIVGYTALMQQGEGKAMSILNRFQLIISEKVKKYNGEIIKTYGDGSLVLFDSTVDAVHCANEMQLAFKESPTVPLRIGIHVGEMVRKDNDVFGNGVNIASRIESMGVAGSVLLSSDVHKKVKNQEAFKMQSLGSFEFKNVEEPIEVYALTNNKLPLPDKFRLQGKFKKEGNTTKNSAPYSKWIGAIGLLLIVSFLSWNFIQKKNIEALPEHPDSEKSIAVLPFADMSPSKDQEYFADGIMEEILNHLVKIEGLQVTSRTSSMTYKGQDKKASEIAHELGVANILEGSVRKSGDALRISIQFINGQTDNQIWSESYDGKIDNVFDMQSDIAIKVADQLRAQIEPEVVERIEKIPTDNMEAYALYLKAIRRDGAESNRLLLEALSLDSTFAQAYSALGRNKLYEVIYTRTTVTDDLEQHLSEVHQLLDKTLKLDPYNSDAYIHKGAIKVWFEWDFDGAKKMYKKAHELNPATSYIAYTELLLAMGDLKEAERSSSANLNANENSGTALVQHAMVNFFLGEYQKADEIIEIVKAKEWILTDGNYLRLLVFQGRYEEMLKNYESIAKEDLYPRLMGYAALSYLHTNQQNKVDSIINSLKLQSETSPIGSPSFHLGLIYAQMGEKNEAFKWLEKAYEDREVEMYWLKVEPPFQPLHDDPRWEELLLSIGFDVPVKG